MAFAVGQKVVCIRADRTDAFGKQELTLNNIYTVRAYGVYHWWWVGHAGPGVWLEGFKRDEWEGEIPDIPFSADRFRPLAERPKETDISVFQKLLTDIPEKVE